MIAFKIILAAVTGGVISMFLFLMERSRMLASALCPASIASLLGLAITYLNQSVWRDYGWTLFVALPIAIGFLSVLIFGAHNPIRLRDAMNVSMLALLFTGVELLIGALEGVICLLMALPLAAPLAALGGYLGYVAVRRIHGASQPIAMFLILTLTPGAGFLEHHGHQPAEIFAVTTTLDIAAPPEVVWRATIAPSKLGLPDDVIFRLGIAYPIAAHIDGAGPVRRAAATFQRET